MTASRDLQQQFIDAAKKGDLATIQKMVSQDKSWIYYIDSEKKSALFHAAWHNRLDVVTYLHKNGASIDAADYRGVTPLLAAADYGHYQCVNYLLEQKANVNHVTSKHGRTAIMYAAESQINSEKKEYLCTMAILNKSPDLNRQCNKKMSVLHYCKGIHKFKLLLEAKANPELKNEDGETVLLTACRNGDVAKVAKLIEYSANVNALDSKDNSVLSLTLKSIMYDYKKIEILKLLFSSNAINPALISNAVNTLETSDPLPDLNLLREAGWHLRFTSLYALLNFGYSNNIYEKCYSDLTYFDKGQTLAPSEKDKISSLIFRAIEDKQFQIACSLVKFCNVNAKNSSGQSLLEVACNKKLGLTLIKAGADIEQLDENNESILMRSIKYGSNEPDMALLLIKMGAKLDLISKKDGSTPLIKAVEKANSAVVKAILEINRNNINAQNKQKRTALFIAGAELYNNHFEGEYKEIIPDLLAAKADLTISAEDGFNRLVTFDDLSKHCKVRKAIEIYKARLAQESSPSYSVLFKPAHSPGDSKSEVDKGGPRRMSMDSD